MNFLKLSLENGKPIWINMENVFDIYVDEQDRTMISPNHDNDFSVQIVKETPEQIFEMLGRRDK